MRFFFLSPVIYSIVEPRSQDTKPDRKLANQSPRQNLTIGATLAILPQQAAREKKKKRFIPSYRYGAFLLLGHVYMYPCYYLPFLRIHCMRYRRISATRSTSRILHFLLKYHGICNQDLFATDVEIKEQNAIRLSSLQTNYLC